MGGKEFPGPKIIASLPDMPRGGRRKGAGRPPKGPSKLVAVEVYVTPETRDLFDDLADETGSTRSELMRIELERAAKRKRAAKDR